MTHFGEHDLTHGSIPHLLAVFSWPLVLTNLLLTSHGLIDMLLAGRFVGADAMSAVTVGGQAILFLITFSMGLAAGGQILIAQLKGADQRSEQSQAVGALFSLSLIAGLAVAVLGFFSAESVLRLLKTPPEAMAGAVTYMRITALSLPFAFLYNAIAGILRGLGDSLRPLLFAASAATLHGGLGLLLMGPFSMGIHGAALATAISQATLALLGVLNLFFRRQGFVFDFRPKSFIPAWDKFRQILKIGVPFGLQMGLLQGSGLVIARLVNPFGVAASAALGAGSRIVGLVTIPLMGIGNGASTIIGQSVGAGKPERVSPAVRWALVYTLGLTAITAALTLLFLAPLIGIFTQEPEVIQIGVHYLTFLAWSYAALSLHSSFNAVVLGVGFSLYSLLAAGAETLVGRIGLAYLFSLWWGLSGIFAAQAIAPYLAVAISLPYYIFGQWRDRKLVE
ncbi:MAG: MATE family efflux transporter [Oscillospiraceae bacterium]|nr:MATE family efflux transporter [Oscillospiraceae bacterium]